MVQTLLNASSTGAGVTKTVDLDTRRMKTLTLAYKLAGTGTTGDLGVLDPLPYDDTAPTAVALTVGLPAVSTTAPAVAGSDVVAIRRYDVSGVDKLKVQAKNNSAGSLNLTVVAFGEYVGH